MALALAVQRNQAESAVLRDIHEFLTSLPTRGDRNTYPLLSGIAQELSSSASLDAASNVIRRAKPRVRAALSVRFGSPVAEAVTIKLLNLLLARYQLKARSLTLLSRPIGLVVDPSNTCRLACPGCVHSSGSTASGVFDWPNGTLSQDRFSALLEHYGAYALGTNFYSYGEPLLNLTTPQLIRRAKTYLMAASISTSLSVQRFDAEAYVASGLDLMILAIDGVTQPVYERFRRGGNLQLVMENLRKLVNAKKALGKRAPTLCWNFLAFEHNAHEIPAAAALARKLGLDYFRVARPFDVGWDDPAIRPAENVTAKTQRQNWMRMNLNRRNNWNPFPQEMPGEAFLQAYDELGNQPAEAGETPNPGRTCHWLYKNMVMDATGRIMPCCGPPGVQANLVFGAFDRGSPDVFNSAKYRRARAGFVAETEPSPADPHCSRCEWDQTTVNIGGPEIRRYFKSAGRPFLDRRTLDLLSDW